MFGNTSLEALLAVVTDLDARHARESHTRRGTSAMKPLVVFLGDFFPAIDVFAQMNTTVFSPIWGSIRLMCTVRGPQSFPWLYADYQVSPKIR